MRVRRDGEILVDTGPGWLVRWHLAGGPWSVQAPAAIGALRGFHHAILAPGATWLMVAHNAEVHVIRLERSSRPLVYEFEPGHGVHANGAASPAGVGYVELTGYAQSRPSSQ
jgi:hypothetical protein